MEYIKIEKEGLKRIIENHKHYINQDCENWQSMRADLNYVDLSYINLYGVNLFDANLENANLENANLTNTNLSGACLENTNLSGANLYKADLSNADLFKANLYKANLSHANLYDTNLYKADLSYADLEGANLYNTIISDKFKIKGEIVTQDIIGYKRCREDIIVTLKIPRGSIVFSINNTKCRTNKVIVLDIEDMDGNKVDRAFSMYNYLSYYIGDEITDYTFNCQYNIECSNGIHFFRTKEEAENYN